MFSTRLATGSPDGGPGRQSLCVHGAVCGEHTLRPQPTQNLNQMGLRPDEPPGKLMVHDRVNGLPPVFEVLREKAPQFVPAGADSRPALLPWSTKTSPK